MPTILCVDNVQKESEAIADVLRRCGHRVTTAGSPEEALRLFDAAPYSFEVVLTDLMFRNSPMNGVRLMHELFDRRNERGYGPTPEVICLTCVEEMQEPNVVNEIIMRGGHFVPKGMARFYIIEVNAALGRIHKYKDKGPTLLFVHSAADAPNWNEPARKKRFCPAGEIISAVYFLRVGQLLGDENVREQRLPLSLRYRQLLDFFARYTLQRAMPLAEVAHSFSQDEFYACWLNPKQDQTISSTSVKNYVLKIRKAFDAIGLKGDEILVSEDLGHDEDDDKPGVSAYRLRAWPIIQHLP